MSSSQPQQTALFSWTDEVKLLLGTIKEYIFNCEASGLDLENTKYDRNLNSLFKIIPTSKTLYKGKNSNHTDKNRLTYRQVTKTL